MPKFITSLHIRWSDLDPNFHLRHSAYYDFGAQHRIELLMAAGITPQVMQEKHIGPVLFREECLFKREIRFNDNVFLSAELVKLRKDASRWTILHKFLSEDHSKILATLSVDGAWMDTHLRKLASPIPQLVIDAMNSFPKSEDFLES